MVRRPPIGQGVGEPAGAGDALLVVAGDVPDVGVAVASAEVGAAVGVGLETTVTSGGAPVCDWAADGLAPVCGVG